MAWLTGWNKRKSKIVNGTTAGAQINYQMKLKVHKSSGTDTATDIYLGTNVRDDFGDVRFTDSDGSTILSYWIDISTLISSISTDIWILISSIPISPGTTTIYIYYDNITTTSISNGIATFNFYDDFEDGNYTSNPVWTPILGTWDAVNRYLHTTISSTSDLKIGSPSSAAIRREWFWNWKSFGTWSNSSFYVGYCKFIWIDENNYYRLFMDVRPDTKDTIMYFQKFVAGISTTLASTIIGSSFDTNWHSFKVTRDISNIFNIYYDNILKFTIVDSSITTSARIVAASYQTGMVSREVAFDNFRIRMFVNPEPMFGITGLEEQVCLSPICNLVVT